MKEFPYGCSGISFRRSCFSKHRLHHYLTSCWGTSTWKPTYGVSHKANSRHQGRSLHKAVFPHPASSALIPANSSREPWYLGAHRRRQDELLILLTTILCCEGHSSGLGVWWINGMRLRKKTVAEEEIDDSDAACLLAVLWAGKQYLILTQNWDRSLPSLTFLWVRKWSIAVLCIQNIHYCTRQTI